MDTLENWAQNSFQIWFIKIGATLIAIGFFLRIIAEIISLL